MRGGALLSSLTRGEIKPGDQIIVVTYFASDEQCRDFGIRPLTRSRICSWCLKYDEENGSRIYPAATSQGGSN